MRPWQDNRVAANGQRVCDNFAHWFASSRVVDGSGQPLLVFHATTADFDEFRQPVSGLKLMDGVGVHCGTLRAAHERLRKSHGASAEGANVLPLYLSIAQFPTKRDGSTMTEIELQSWLSRVAQRAGVDKHKTRAYSSAYPLRGEVFATLKAALREHGFDGLAYVNSHEDRGSVSYVAFDGHQVKSAVGNAGLFLRHSASLTDRDAAWALERAQAARHAIEPRCLGMTP